MGRRRGVKRRKDLSDFVAKTGKYFYVDREDIDTGVEIAKPGDTIKFKWHKKKYKAKVTGKSHGRDDDVYKLKLIE